MRTLKALLLSLFVGQAGALTKSISLDQPFQSSFKNLKQSACVTLYYRNGRVGCGTHERETQSGPLFYYDGSQTLPSGRTFVAVVEEFGFSTSMVSGIFAANTYGNLKGILVLNSTDANDSNDYISPGPIYPNGYGTPSEYISYGNVQFPWNGNGDDLLMYDMYGVPVVYINEYETSNYIREASQDSNKAAKIYSEFNFYMGPDGIKSKECLAWVDEHDEKWNPKCLPLGGTSVWGFAGSPPKGSNSYGNGGNEENEENEVEEEENGNERKLEQAGDNGEEDEENQNNYSNVYSSVKPAVVIGGSMDTTSLFHDLAPGANEAASNTLVLLMAAYLIGQSVTDATLDALPTRIVFGFFEGEAYGFLGSRSFLRDVMGFQCKQAYTVNSVSKDENSEKACLYPLRPSLKFKDIGEIVAMLTVDQIGAPTGAGQLYVHNDGAGDMGTFLANLLKYTGTDEYTAVASAAGENADEYPYPPTPLTSLLALTGGAYGGAVLSGYDYAYTSRPPYQSHLNWVKNKAMNYGAIASAATIVARTALAAAYDDGSYDYETASEYAIETIEELSADNEMLVELANCLFVDGNCKLLKKHAEMEAVNERDRTGFDISSGEALGVPPNYYVGVYKIDYGQPFVRVGDDFFGAYDGEKYGDKKSDAFGMQPRMLEQAIRNLLHDFLGRSSFRDESSGSNMSPRSCRKQSDCNGVEYCSTSDDAATCSANKICVCQRAFYHIALDESLVPAVNNYTGYFDISENDQGITPMWTEPYWSNDIGAKMYRVSKGNPGFISLAFGLLVMGACFFIAVLVKVGMKKAKVY